MTTWCVVCAVSAGVPALAQMPKSKVVVVSAEMRSAPATITVIGTVEPVYRSRVAAEIAGLVVEMSVRQGDSVREGDVICRLRDDTLTLQLAEARARLDSLKARHQELVSGSRPQELKRLKAFVDEAAADFERWDAEMKRVRKLYDSKDSNVKEVYDTRAGYLRAERRKVAAEAAHEMGLEGPRVEVIAQAAYDVAAQQAVVQRIENDLSKTIIRAPFDGYVTKRTVEKGEWIAAGSEAVEVVDLSTVLVRADAPEAVYPFLIVGRPAFVKVDALGRTFDAKIKHVIRQADTTARTFPVYVEVENPEGLLAAGMFARVTIPAGSDQEFVAVPKDALVEKGGVTKVATIMPGRQGGMVAILIPVTIGSDVADWITITSGNIQPGMSIVVRGNENLMPFPTPVDVVDEHGSPVVAPESTEGAGHHPPHEGA